MALLREKWPIEVGDSVLVTRSRGGYSAATVTKIGSKLVHVEQNGWNKDAFYLLTGARRDGNPGHIRTPDQHVSEERRAEIGKILRDVYHIEISFYRSNWDTPALEELLAALEDISTRHDIKVKNQ